MNRRALFVAVAVAAIIPFIPLLVTGDIPILRDHHDYFVPLRHFTASELSEGRVPFWNPYNGAGEPWLANPQTAIFYPPAWLFFLLPFATAYVLYLAAHLALLAAGCFTLFARRTTPAAAALGAAAAALSGPVLSLLDVGNNLTTLAWIPAALACALSRRESIARWPRAALSLLLALMFLGGEPFLAAIGWAATAVAMTAGDLRRRAADAVATFGIALLLISAQLLPFLSMLRGSDRAAGLGAEALENSMPLRDWLGMIVHPTWSAAPHAPVGSQQFILSIYAGAAIVALALLALAQSRADRSRRSDVIVSSGIILGVALFAAGGHLPGADAWWPALGLDAVRFPSRVVPFAAIALAYLAALGADAAAAAPRRTRGVVAAIVVALTAVALASQLAGREAMIFSLVATATVASFVILAPAIARHRFGILLVALLIAVDLGMAARWLLRGAPLASFGDVASRGDRAASRDQSGSLLDAQLGTGERLATVGPPAAGGYANLLVRQGDLSSPAPVIDASGAAIRDAALFGPRTDILNFLSVRGVVTSRAISHPAFVAVESRREDGSRFGYENLRALPPVMLWNAWAIASDARTALQAVLRGAVVVDRLPIVAGPAVPKSPRMDAGSAGSARLVLLDTRHAVIEVRARREALLTLNQSHANGWTVTIDGDPAKLLRVNGNFLGVVVPAGVHRVVWRHGPPFLTLGIVLSLAGLAFAASDAYVHRRARSRDPLVA